MAKMDKRVSKCISKSIRKGKPHKQSIAICLSEERRKKKKK